MCKVINFEERRAKKEQKRIDEQIQNDLADFFNMLQYVDPDELGQKILEAQNVTFEGLDIKGKQVIEIELGGGEEEKTPEEIDAEIRRILDEESAKDLLDKIDQESMIKDLMEEVAEDKPNTADEIANHFVENGDARDLVIKVEKESYTSVIVIKYEEIEKKLLDAYGRPWLHDMYMRKDHEEQFRVLMELCRIRDIEYEDLSDDEKTSFSYIIIHLRNDLC